MTDASARGTEPARRIRVLWLTKGLGPGGTERLLVEHAAAGDRDAFEYEAAYLLPWKHHLVPELAARGVPAHCFGVRAEADVRWLTRLDHLIHRGRFDIVHCHSPSVAAAARPVAKARSRARRPAFVYTEHNRWPSYKRVTRVANRVTYRMNDAIIAVSDDVRASVAPALRSRVEVVLHGIDLDRVRGTSSERDAVRAEFGLAPRELLAVTVANLRAQKNYPGLLEAARLVVDREVPLCFVAAGQGPLETEVRDEHAALALGDQFRLLGYRDDTTRLIAAADLFVLASHHEGLPVSVMEALALGVPVVAPAVGGLQEAVTDGESGVLVRPDDPAALADAITDVATDAELRAKLGAGAVRDGARFSSAGAVARVEAIYRDVA
jgi:glycosyltransferase involved in cell wall biosynthesis